MGGRENQQEGERPARRARLPDKPPLDLSIPKKKGFLIWTAAGQNGPRSCPVFTRLKAMESTERICLDFVMRGRACRYGADCRAAHPGSFTVLDEKAQKELKAYVDRTTGLEFAPGEGPAGKEKEKEKDEKEKGADKE